MIANVYQLNWEVSQKYETARYALIMGINPRAVARAVRLFRAAGMYQAVATVNASNAEDAYSLTQNIDRPWWENSKRVQRLFKGEGCRSTSCGDLIEDADTGKFQVVLARGMGDLS